jgi:hypothetical protein
MSTTTKNIIGIVFLILFFWFGSAAYQANQPTESKHSKEWHRCVNDMRIYGNRSDINAVAVCDRLGLK